MILCSKLVGNIDYYNLNFQSYIYIFIIIAIAIFYINDTNNKRKKIIIYILFFDYLYIGINTFFQLQINPSISRVLATSAEHVESILGEVTMSGIGSYSYFYALVIISILMCHYMLNTNKKKLLLIILLVGIFLLLVNAQFTMSVLFFIFFIFFVLITEKKTSAKYFMIRILFLIAFIIILLNIGSIINYVSNFVGEDLAVRLNELNDSLLGNGYSQGDIGARIDVYKMSINSFFNNILYGSFGNKNFGGHSSILDILGAYGIIGFSAIYTFFKMYKLIIKSVRKYQRNVVKICFIYFIVLSFLNPAHLSTIIIALFIVIPLFLDLISNNQIKNFNKKI